MRQASINAHIKHKFRRLSKHAFGIPSHAIIERFIHAKVPPHLKKSLNQANLESGIYKQIVTHRKWELNLNFLEAPDELHVKTVNQMPRMHLLKKTRTLQKPVMLVGKRKTTKKAMKMLLDILKVARITLTPLLTKRTKSLKESVYPVGHLERQTTIQRNATFEPMQQTNHFPGTEYQKNRPRANNVTPKNKEKENDRAAAQHLN